MRVKNVSGSTKVYCGQTITNNQEYDIEANEIWKWQSDSSVITDISSLILLIGDGVNYKSDSVSAINYLLGVETSPKDSAGVPLTRSKPFSDTDSFRFRGIGITGIANAGAESNIDYKFTVERYINGVDLILKNHVFGDYLKFQIVDKEYLYAGVLYEATYTGGVPWSVAQPNGVVLDEFATLWYVSEEQRQGQIIIPYPARIYQNLYIRIIYKSYGANNVDLKANLFLHWKTE
jgi:hypothetical protein